MADPYVTLGVARDATDDVIRQAYRKLAKQYHPDMNPGRPDTSDRFKTIVGAYDLLSDPVRRARFDRGEIDGDGNDTGMARPWPTGGRASNGAGNGFTAEDLEALFGQAFGDRAHADRFGPDRAGSERPGGIGHGRDLQFGITVSFREAAKGAVRRVQMPDGREVDVTIPSGLKSGHVLRLKGQGRRGVISHGDALIEVKVTPDLLFRREGDNIVMDLPITLSEAVLGANVSVPTLTGPVRVTIPPGSGTGSRLRLKGRGINGGHQFVVLKPILAEGEEPALAAFLKSWQPEHPFDPREDLDKG